MQQIDKPFFYKCNNRGPKPITTFPDIIDFDFIGNEGSAIFTRTAFYTRLGVREYRRRFLTGDYDVRDVFCMDCNARLGWRYIRAPNGSQAYKVGNYVLENSRIEGYDASNAQDENVQNRDVEIARRADQLIDRVLAEAVQVAAARAPAYAQDHIEPIGGLNLGANGSVNVHIENEPGNINMEIEPAEANPADVQMEIEPAGGPQEDLNEPVLPRNVQPQRLEHEGAFVVQGAEGGVRANERRMRRPYIRLNRAEVEQYFRDRDMPYRRPSGNLPRNDS